MKEVDEKIKSEILPFVENLEVFLEEQINEFIQKNFPDVTREGVALHISWKILEHCRSYIDYMIENNKKTMTALLPKMHLWCDKCHKQKHPSDVRVDGERIKDGDRGKYFPSQICKECYETQEIK